MKIGSLLTGCLPVVLLLACGGETKTSPQNAANTNSSSSGSGEVASNGGGDGQADANAQKADTPANGTSNAAAPKADAPQDPKPKKRIRRPRINTALVKPLFGNDPSSPKAEVEATPDLVALGNALYHARGLSANSEQSCASCHDLANYGVDNQKTSSGEKGDRNAPTTYNAFRHFRQFWDGRSESVEAQVVDPIAHGFADTAAAITKIKEQDRLVGLFQKAFPGQDDPITAGNLGAAIGAFERTLVTKSKWDAYLDGNQKAMSNEELLGLKTFMDVGCTQCHMTRLLGGHTYQKLGVLKPYSGKDTGRMQVTGQESDKYMFKVPSLLNVAKTAPYYHDGSIATLEDAVKDMADNQLNKKLKPEQVEALVAFLNALTGDLPKEFAKK
ncbi:MAG: cytochrome-c peroxidase [Planctomycetota bacterium]